MDVSLTNQKCVPCEGTAKPMTPDQYGVHLRDVPEWNVIQEKEIQKEFKFKNFREAVAFIDRVGALAEEEGHHPDMYLHGWNKVTITLSTHAIHGLSLNDFIVAAKADHIVKTAS